VKKRGPVLRVPDPRDKRIAELERATTFWRKRTERAEALIEVPKTSRRCWGRRTPSAPHSYRDRGGIPTRHRADIGAWNTAADLLAPRSVVVGLSPNAAN
jgi:hypothetical protein